MASIFRLLPPAQKISTRQEATALIKRLEPKRLIAFDTETTGLSRTRDYAVLLSLSDGEGRWAVWPSALPYFQEFLEFPGRRLIGHNVNFDQWMLLNVGIDLDRFTQTNYARCIDTMVMHALWDDSAPHDLKYLARQYLNIDMVPFKELYGAQLRTRPLKEIFLDPKNEAKTVNYSALDAYATFRLFLCLQRQLQDAKITEPESSYTDLWDYYLRSEIPFTKVLWHMERRGIALNEDTLLDRAPRLELEIANLLHWFCKQLRRFDVNLSSNPQMVALFFDKLGKQVLTRTAGGAPQLSKVALKTWAAQGCEYSKNLLAYRDKTKNLGTYVEGLLDEVHHDGRVHTTFVQTGARSGRLACCAHWTPVETARGFVPIRDVRQGDLVRTHKNNMREVLAHWSSGEQDTLDFVLENGQILTCTTTHRLLTGSGDWVRAGDLAYACLKVERGQFEPDDGKDPGAAPQLGRGVRRWLRLLNLPPLGPEDVCTPGSDGRSAWPVEPAGRAGRAPYRREQEEQRAGQLSTSYTPGAPRYSLSTGEGLPWCRVKEINLGKRCEVFDLNVAEDESYISCGVTSHNSRQPNLQNQPPYSRDAYVASPGFVLLARDYQQLEMRILAHVSGDEALCEAINSGKDVHAATAADMYGIPYNDIATAKEKDDKGAPLEPHDKHCLAKRKAAKTLQFGLVYGMGHTKLARELGCSVDEAKDTIKRYFAAKPRVKEYFAKITALAREQGYCTTVLGRRRQVRGLWSPLTREQARAERQVKNSPIQGFASEITKLAMIAIEHDEFIRQTGTRMLLQVHDEIIFEVPVEHSTNKELLNRINHHMATAVGVVLKVPLDTSGKFGKTWAECK